MTVKRYEIHPSDLSKVLIREKENGYWVTHDDYSREKHRADHLKYLIEKHNAVVVDEMSCGMHGMSSLLIPLYPHCECEKLCAICEIADRSGDVE